MAGRLSMGIRGHHRARRIRFAVLMLIVATGLACAVASPAHTAVGTIPVSDEAANFDSVRRSGKVHRSDTILQSFQRGEKETRVIVHVLTVDWPQFADDIRHVHRREEVRNQARSLQDPVIKRFAPNEVKLGNRFSYIPAFGAGVTLQGLRHLLEDPDVERVEPDRILEPHTAQGIPLMNASLVRSVYGGRGVAIAVCDTGIDYTHSMLGGGGFPNSKVIGGYDFGSKDSDPMDQYGHGTSCAGIAGGSAGSFGDYIGGIAKDAKLYALKITPGNSGSAAESDMIAAWDWCVTHQYDDPSNPILVVTTSFGGGGYASRCDDESPAMTQAAANLVAAGITVFASSGNDGYCDRIAWPACISHVISVGAVFDANIGTLGFCVDPSSCAPNLQDYQACSPRKVAWAYTAADQVTPYSNIANFLDLLAPSNNAFTTARGGGYTGGFGGTSAACPYAAGAAAVMQSAAKAGRGAFASPQQVREELATYGNPITNLAGTMTKPRVNAGAMDIDGDGMPAQWELEHFGNMSRNETTDADNDGLTDLQEYLRGTDPNNRDTDGDGFTDGEEAAAGTNPLDPQSKPVETPAAGGPVLSVALATLMIYGFQRMKNA